MLIKFVDEVKTQKNQKESDANWERGKQSRLQKKYEHALDLFKTQLEIFQGELTIYEGA